MNSFKQIEQGLLTTCDHSGTSDVTSDILVSVLGAEKESVKSFAMILSSLLICSQQDLDQVLC